MPQDKRKTTGLTQEELLEEQHNLTVRVREYTAEAKNLRTRLAHTKDELEVTLNELEYYLGQQSVVRGMLEDLG